MIQVGTKPKKKSKPLSTVVRQLRSTRVQQGVGRALVECDTDTDCEQKNGNSPASMSDHMLSKPSFARDAEADALNAAVATAHLEHKRQRKLAGKP